MSFQEWLQYQWDSTSKYYNYWSEFFKEAPSNVAESVVHAVEWSGNILVDSIDWLISGLITTGTFLTVSLIDGMGIGESIGNMVQTDAVNSLIAAVSFSSNFVSFPTVFGALGVALSVVVGVAIVKLGIKLIPFVG